MEKRGNESEFEHHKRLILGKLKDKTLADYDYAELAPYVYGQDYSVDVARRMMYGSARTLEKMDEERVSNIADNSLLNEIEVKKIELQCEKQKFLDQRREFNKLVAQLGREDHINDQLVAAAERIPETIGRLVDEPFWNEWNEQHESDNEAVLVLSDWHYGMVTDNVFNRYDTEICRQRVTNVIKSAIDRITLHQCSKLHVVLLGDFISGGIHSSTRVASEELVCDQLMQVSEILAQAIIALSTYVHETAVYATYGNHGRVMPKKDENIHRDNYERIIPWWLAQRIKAEEAVIGHKLNINIDDDNGTEFLFFSPCGIDMCAAHGDLDGVKQSPQMLGTLFHKVYNKDIKAILLGDKHHRESFEELGITSMIVGSLCGSDDYANMKRLYSVPSQLLLIVNPRDGIDAEYQLKCDKE